jgi:hypothetical protein
MSSAGARGSAVRFLFTTLQFVESDFYRRVSARLEERGHSCAHVAYSHVAARDLRAAGHDAWCLPDVMAELGPVDVAAETARLESRYPIPSLRDVYLTDWTSRGRGEAANVERTVGHFLALERIVDEAAPDVAVPEVGSEVMRTVTHLVARDRGITVLFLFYTIFPEPLRLYVDEPDGPIVAPEEVRELDAQERAQVEAFVAGFLARRRPILAHRPPTLTAGKLRDFARHIRVRATEERDNDYLRPGRFVQNFATQQARRAAISRMYDEVPAQRPFVYFPLHVTDDFKIKRLIPHCSDQAYLIEQLADALPQGHDLVLKEHPVSIGRNPVSMLRRLVRRENVRLVDPYTSSHELIERSAAVAVIGSTVGLEALLFGKPVLTLGRPFYAGYGVTVDVESFREIKEKLVETLHFAPDRERILRFLGAAMRATEAGAPAGVDLSDANAELLAASLDAAARRHAPEPARAALAGR